MTVTNDAPRGTVPATAHGSEVARRVRPGSAEYRSAADQARAILASQERERRARRDARWTELAEQLLLTMPQRIATEEQLFLAAYSVVKGDRLAALSTPDAMALREVTRRVWLAQDPGETQVSQVRTVGIEEAATAGDCSPSSGTGATAVVSAASVISARSSSPVVPDLLAGPLPVQANGQPDYFLVCAGLSRAQMATLPATPAPSTCCDESRVVSVECPVCEGDACRPVQVGRMSPPEYSECPRCEGTGTITECESCGTEVDA